MPTVQELKDEIKELGHKVPSKARKADLEYLLDQLRKGSVRTRELVDRDLKVVPVWKDERVEDHFSEYGWDIIDTELDHKAAYEGMVDWMRSLDPSFDPKVGKHNLFQLHGIFKYYIGHSPFLWKARMEVLPVFADFWACEKEDLLSSFDGGCFEAPKKKSRDFWFHSDQSRDSPRFEGVHGIVNLVENGPDDGGTILLEGSHKHVRRFFKENPTVGVGESFFYVEPRDPVFKDCRIIKPCLKAGQILLFSSQTIHCNCAPTGKRNRVVLYVSMQPREYVDAPTLAKRIKAFEDRRMTGHACSGRSFVVLPHNPRDYGKMEKLSKEQIPTIKPNYLQRRLIGYER